MPTLREISEAGAAAHERMVRQSIAFDYAYLADISTLENGGKASRLHALIDRTYETALGELYGNSNGGAASGG